MTPPQLTDSGGSAGPRLRPWVAVVAIVVFLAIWTALFGALISAHVSAIQSSRVALTTHHHATASRSADRL